MSRKALAATISVCSNSILIVLKLLVGWLSGSVSIIAEAIHSANDLLAALIALVSVRIAERPPDAQHPYGHGKAEGISAALEALLIVGAAIWIVVESVDRILHPRPVENLTLGIAVMSISALLNTVVSRYLFRVAREEDSPALEADAQHLATDVYTSLGVIAGLALTGATGWYLIDPLVAIGVALLILHIGWSLTTKSVHHLMDAQLPSAEVSRIEHILNTEARIHSWHNLRTRKAGNTRHIDLHIVFRNDATLVEAHQVADELEKRIAAELAPAQVVIHVDPYDPQKETAAKNTSH
ncbi:MAG: cation diffusion facilitator family transporter [Armatimonadota bacterium]|nr:cation diffusion facilitator family transporter [bacterium]MCS7309472.1 cation diffusion facilitator family transporter [Armatimonadota bacterium]MDW8104471.1 cation diffusion facilitator family transporter [Armatimonadota bacterium]MDW8291041.1 cation diffusion facilitator family transporter [Armatimonadota bacterium]